MELSKAAYNCEWYNLDAKKARDVMFILQQAQCPPEITAGKFCSLSMSLFTAVGLKTRNIYTVPAG